MIELRFETPALWAREASARPLELLCDHAHCELAAATTAESLIAKNPTLPLLVDRLSALAIEELQHFRRVVRELRARGGELRSVGSNPYASGLRRGAAESRRSSLLDKLVIAALIETRSCERFELLAQEADDPGLRELYADLSDSERGHGELFEGLARRTFPAAEVAARIETLVEVEARLVESLPFAPRMHSGPPGSGQAAPKLDRIAVRS